MTSFRDRAAPDDPEALADPGLQRWDEAAEAVDRLRQKRPAVPEIEQLAAGIAEQRG